MSCRSHDLKKYGINWHALHLFLLIYKSHNIFMNIASIISNGSQTRALTIYVHVV